MKIVTRIAIAGCLAISVASYAQTTDNTIRTDSTSRSTTENNSTTTVKSPPPTAVAPAVTSINNDVCAVAASGAVQTQILGISMGGTMRDMNCERIKLSKNLYDMGMKVAAVATLCQDERVFAAMLAAGTPCPIDGKIGEQAKAEWEKRNVLANQETKNLGYYAVQAPSIDLRQPTPTPQSGTEPGKEVPKSTNVGGCADYRGDDPIVRSRVCGK
jgi:hypothetical protein